MRPSSYTRTGSSSRRRVSFRFLDTPRPLPVRAGGAGRRPGRAAAVGDPAPDDVGAPARLAPDHPGGGERLVLQPDVAEVPLADVEVVGDVLRSPGRVVRGPRGVVGHDPTRPRTPLPCQSPRDRGHRGARCGTVGVTPV